MGRRRGWTDQRLYEERERKKRLHPAWRGAGCLLIVLLGVAAYFFSGWFIQAGLVYIPPEARNPDFASFLPEDSLVQGVISVIFMLLCYTVLSTIYAVLFPVKPGEFDAPPPKRKGPRRRR